MTAPNDSSSTGILPVAVPKGRTRERARQQPKAKRSFFRDIFKTRKPKLSKRVLREIEKAAKARLNIRPRSLLSRILKPVLIAAGGSLVLLGILIAPLPGPMGMPLSIAGLIIMMRNSYWTKRKFMELKRSHPNWIMPLRKLLRKNPPIFSIFWQQILRTERLLLKKEGKMLSAFRRRFLRKHRHH